ncbi:uncharacterized protein LOC126330810 [Schistocerca gregaria]|uniref:uncharacterized protein LOC126330810 n=1 Tax=Schistocerca gregaria TaxID=7010 RepID=UPI00211E2C11|nr:uncharacterized protein LOC126330810 [Schistocerca gregaria]
MTYYSSRLVWSDTQDGAILSPGFFNSNRLAIGSNGSSLSMFVASGAGVYYAPYASHSRKAKCPTENGVADEGTDLGGENIRALNRECRAQQGAFEKTSNTNVDFCLDRVEIQSLMQQYDSIHHRNILYAIGTAGLAIAMDVTEIGDNFKSVLENQKEGSISLSKLSYPKHRSHLLVPPSFRIPNLTRWSGISCHSTQPSRCCTARYIDKLVCLYDKDVLLNFFHTVHSPTQLRLISPNLLAITEQHILSLWDLRISTTSPQGASTDSESTRREACVQRLRVENGKTLWAMDVADEPIIGVGGQGRCVFIFDLRRSGPIATWDHCVKYELTHLKFSQQNPSILSIAGADRELICGKWERRRQALTCHERHIRSMDKWTGMAASPLTDSIFALTMQGELYEIENVSNWLEE